MRYYVSKWYVRIVLGWGFCKHWKLKLHQLWSSLDPISMCVRVCVCVCASDHRVYQCIPTKLNSYFYREND